MRYFIRNGIVFETVCGECMLFATYQAREYCPAIFALNDASAFIWKLLEKGYTVEEIASEASVEYSISLEDASEAVKGFVKILLEKGYLLEGSN